MWLLASKRTHMSLGDIAYILRNQIQSSRFTSILELDSLRNKLGLKLSVIRLKNKKDYCGAHPGPCLANRRHRMGAWLEGLDWVGWNALLNNTLDKFALACDVFSFNNESKSGKYFIRRGKCRRINYPYTYALSGNFALWDQGTVEDDFADHCGKKPPAWPWRLLNDGTPGYACYTLKDEARLKREELKLK